MFDLQIFINVGAILLVILIIDKSLEKWLKAIDQQELKEARDLLEKHGYTSHLYCPSIGVKDMKIAHAMERVAHNGFLMLDKDGRLVGKALPNLKKEKHSSLRLVVDNTK